MTDTTTPEIPNTEERLDELERLRQRLQWDEMTALEEGNVRARLFELLGWLVPQHRSLLAIVRGDDRERVEMPDDGGTYDDPSPAQEQASAINGARYQAQKARANLRKANSWIAHLERELHALGGPAPRIAPIIEAQERREGRAPERARSPTLPPAPSAIAAALARGAERVAEPREIAEAFARGVEQAELVRGMCAPIASGIASNGMSVWSKEPPRVAGLYWAIKRGASEPVIVDWYDGGGMVAFRIDNTHGAEAFECWGPRLLPPE